MGEKAHLFMNHMRRMYKNLDENTAASRIIELIEAERYAVESLAKDEYEKQMEKVESVLLGIGGTRVVGMGVNWYAGKLAEHGRQFRTNGLRAKIGRASCCHGNVAELFFSPRYQNAHIVNGYGLSDDGIWRHHSWLLHQGRIIETTKARKVYYGYQLTNDEAIPFCWRNIDAI
jgi:hypothetical protein